MVFVVTLALVGADLVVTGQNSNSNDPGQNSNISTGDTNMNMGRRRRRRGRRRTPRPMPNTNAACGMEDTSTAGGMQGNMGASQTPVRYGRCDPNQQTQENLNGTYTGTVNYTDGGLSGDATLTIDGNNFTLTSGSTTQEGTVTAVNTCNYIAVTMMFGKPQMTAPTGAQPAALPAVSLRARRMGGGITLTSVQEAKQFSFSSAGTGGGGGRRRRGRRRSANMSGNACGPMAHAVTVQ